MPTEINNWYFEQRGTSSSAVFEGALPENYKFAQLHAQGATSTMASHSIDGLAGLGMVEACLLVPEEHWIMIN